MSLPDEAKLDVPQVTTWFKVVSKWASLVKDLLSSVKDFGLILFFALLVAWPKPIVNFLKSRNLDLAEINIFGVKMPFNSALNELEARGEAQQLTETVSEAVLEEPASPAAIALSATETSLAPLTAKIEARVLESETAARVLDWALVLSAAETLEKAKEEVLKKGNFGAEIDTIIARKRQVFRIVARAGSREELESILATVRLRYPTSYLVSFSRWCPSAETKEGVLICSEK